MLNQTLKIGTNVHKQEDKRACSKDMEANIKKSQIKNLYDSAFPADKNWNNWFFNCIYKDNEAQYLEVENRIVSCLFIQHYNFCYHGESLPMTYISGVATDRKQRGQGYMSRLMVESLRKSRERGDVLAGVIPADRRLFFLYDKFGFSTVVFADIERWTALHSFPFYEDLIEVKPSFNAFQTLEREREMTVLHSSTDFENILRDVEMDGGTVVQVNTTGGVPVAMAFATADEQEICVKEVLGSEPRAVDMALGLVKKNIGKQLPMAVWRKPDIRKSMLRSRGMLRIVNVEKILSSLASKFPEVNQIVRVSDRLIEENNGIYVISGGDCVKKENVPYKLTLDVTIDVLTSILFGSRETGNIFGIPADHPLMNLMLD